MVPSRGLTVLVATVLGVVGGITAYLGLHSAQQKVFRHAKAASVYVVRAQVPRDDTGATAYDHGLIVRSAMPVKYVPVGAVTDLADIDDRVADANLPVGTVVTHAMFVSASSNPGAAAQSVPPGDVAVSVSVTQSEGVAGMVQPGDKVDVLVNVKSGEEAFLFQDVPVLAVGQTLVPPPSSAPSAAAPATTGPTNDLITFALTPAAAAHIPPAKADTEGITPGVYLALDAANTTTPASTTVIAPNLIPGVPRGSGSSGTGSKGTGSSKGSGTTTTTSEPFDHDQGVTITGPGVNPNGPTP